MFNPHIHFVVLDGKSSQVADDDFNNNFHSFSKTPSLRFKRLNSKSFQDNADVNDFIASIVSIINSLSIDDNTSFYLNPNSNEDSMLSDNEMKLILHEFVERYFHTQPLEIRNNILKNMEEDMTNTLINGHNLDDRYTIDTFATWLSNYFEERKETLIHH